MSSKHPRFHSLPSRLFRGVSHFRDLESRISSLGTELARGDAFEVFVEAFLATAPVWQVAKLWLVGQVPLDVRRTLNLPADAKGIDGVFCTRSGRLVPYQVKFRIGRPQIGFAEVATFLGLTNRAEDRVLISNADRYAGDVEVRVRLLRGSDFDALSADDWVAISDWMEKRPVTRRRATPREDQRQALAAIAQTLASHDRATVVMPCGTGKTLVQLWAAEQQEPCSVLVLVPSLALLSQTLDEWGRHTSWGDRFEYLCVCSDPSVSREQDAIQMRSTDVPFPVDTDPAAIRRFLDRPSAGTVRVVFSTYQSSPVVSQGARGLQPFDLAIFDEAHKTTGPRDGNFALALDDAKLRIRKRLFLTATPRHLDIRHRDREGDFRRVSMDDPALYGPRAYTQTFAEAVDLGIICDYRVVVSVVDPEEISAFALQHGVTLVQGDHHTTQWVATQIAVSKAIAETGATKVITFHSRVKQAEEFASPGSHGIGQYLDGFVVDHVNGQQRVADRKAILAGFKDGCRRLVTNARCLTEGVDLPAVDMVVFSSPRKSRVDIVQAVGRAMRKPKEGTKALGYVVVPIPIGPSDVNAVAEASADTEWHDVIDVLSALREHDARLEEIIHAQQVSRGRSEIFNPRAFAERVVVLGPLVSLEVLERTLCAAVLQRLGVTWDERYGQLIAFKARYGHCNVPNDYAESRQLATWLDHQRQFKKSGQLSCERESLLAALGVDWDPRDAQWEQMYEALCRFKAREGHCNVPEGYRADPALARWLYTQRQAWAAKKRSRRLSLERIARLERLGVVWDPFDVLWERRYRELMTFVQLHGHCGIPKDGSPPRKWLDTQRRLKNKGTLSVERVARLEALGVTWALPSPPPRWEQSFHELVVFREREGHVDPPYRTALDSWLSSQRRLWRKGGLQLDRRERLEGLGVSASDPRDPRWEQRFQELIAFRQKHGHVHPAYRTPLGTWLRNQRDFLRCGQLHPQRFERLNALGVFGSKARDAHWEQRFQELVAYRSRHGHCNPSTYGGEHTGLANWLTLQRRHKKRGTLARDRLVRLEALGVVWEPKAAKFAMS